MWVVKIVMNALMCFNLHQSHLIFFSQCGCMTMNKMEWFSETSRLYLACTRYLTKSSVS